MFHASLLLRRQGLRNIPIPRVLFSNHQLNIETFPKSPQIVLTVVALACGC